MAMTPSDAAALVGLSSIIGLTFLFTAVSGREYHTMDPIKINKRIGAIIGAQLVLAFPVVAVLLFTNVSASELYGGADVWRTSGIGEFGIISWIVYAGTLLALASPLITTATLVNLILKKNRGEELRLT